MEETAVVVLKVPKRNISVDLEIPLFITANDLVQSLNTAFELGIDLSDIQKCYLKSERPIALLKGNALLSELGLRNGSIIYYTE